MPSQLIYQTSATATGGRDGAATLSDSDVSFRLVAPKQPGAPADGVNPEQLFAAGYAACFLSALKHVAQAQKVKLPAEASTTTTVGIGPRDEGGFGLEVSIEVSLPGVDAGTAQALVDTAHQVCPYSNATRGGLSITPTLA
ncbi:organic hydroperoxide resistance protein [Thalassovita taeanensis]|uniref:Peroxiredoxin, Ohr subfamily n=1 Tax=Thalassovita taeanensis TaxID=657014 RepID=A0A1H9FCE7_9RHOB|nr:organic hydroperoxide resistance protein [Thalassovita taeanensis]SEQ35604.1 peroxiredoxin, Ohr subfamily [Thalassovita taeanensis]